MKKSDMDEILNLTPDNYFTEEEQSSLDEQTEEYVKKCKEKSYKPTHRVCQQKIDSEAALSAYSCLNENIPLAPISKSLQSAIDTLNSEFPWFLKANQELHRQLNARQQSSTSVFKIRPLLLAGHPGVGKTSWVKRISELFGVPLDLIMAAGGHDTMHLKGSARGWANSQPGEVARMIASEKIANPIFLVDEIDKSAKNSQNGSILDSLLQLIEPATAKNYIDECLRVSCDFSYVSWIATCNSLSNLPKPLLDRFTIIYVDKPGPEHTSAIVKSAIRFFAADLDIDERMLPKLDGQELKALEGLTPRAISSVVRRMMEIKLSVKPEYH